MTSFSGHLLRLHSRWARPVFLTCMGAVAFFVALGFARPPFQAMAAIVMPVALSLGLAAVLPARWPLLSHSVHVRADARGVFLGTVFLPRSEIHRALLTPTPSVVLFGRRNEEVLVATASEGRALLAALGLDAAHASATFRAKLPVGVYALFPLLAGVWVPGALLMLVIKHPTAIHFAGSALCGICGIAGSVLAVAASRVEVAVGADGVALNTLLARRRVHFLPLSRIQGVEIWWVMETRIKVPVEAGIIVRHDGGELRLLVADKRERHMLLERIQSAVEALRRPTQALTVGALSRGKRSVHEWVLALRALGSGGGADFRVAALSTEDLLRIAEDPAASPSERAAAAIAASSTAENPRIRARLRDVARATAVRPLQDLITSLDGGTDQAVEAALAELEPLETLER